VTAIDSERQPHRLARALPYGLAYAALLGCFAITLFTNNILIGLVRALLHKGAEWPAGGQHAEMLSSAKNSLFFLCLLVLGFLLWRSATRLWPLLRRRAQWIDVAIGLAIASVFVLQFFVMGMGRAYGEISLDPFAQEPGFYHRRILMPALAHYLQFGGVFYVLFYWAVLAVTFALALVYLERKSLSLSRIELGSLFTTGIFAAAIGLPGYAEILVFGLALVALLDFDETKQAGVVQLVCFGLAMLTHESAAIVMFVPMALCLFGLRCLSHFAALLLLYAILWLASYGFDWHSGFLVQMSGGQSNTGFFWQSIPHMLFAVLTVWKLGLVAAAIAVTQAAAARDYRTAGLIVLALGGGIALTYIATDYSRMIAFGSFALLFALPPVLAKLSPGRRTWLAAINLLIPTLYVGAHHVPQSYPGLYRILLRPFGLG
jgi:hypothetical protein